MQSCPKYQSCCAPICPLDPEWSKRSMLDGERTCLYLREIAKGGDLRGVLPGELAERVAEVYPEILARYGYIRRGLKAAAKSGSKIRALHK